MLSKVTELCYRYVGGAAVCYLERHRTRYHHYTLWATGVGLTGPYELLNI